MAWERLHVLARNPIPPASSDNSLSASFPPPPPPPLSPAAAALPRTLHAIHDDSAALTRGPILGLDLPPATHQTDVLAVPLQDLYTTHPLPPPTPPLSFLLRSLSFSRSVRRVAFSNFPYAPTNLRLRARERRGERAEREVEGALT